MITLTFGMSGYERRLLDAAIRLLKRALPPRVPACFACYNLNCRYRLLEPGD